MGWREGKQEQVFACQVRNCSCCLVAAILLESFGGQPSHRTAIFDLTRFLVWASQQSNAKAFGSGDKARHD